MKKGVKLTLAVYLLLSGQVALAASPIPTFDKEAVTTHPYNRTGQQEIISTDKLKEVQDKETYQPGNTGTEENPAFFVKEIKLTGFEVPDKDGKLSEILAKYSNRNVQVDELTKLTSEITEYCRTCGYTIPQAVYPKQEIKDGVLEVKIYVAKYDEVKIVKNDSEVADRVLEKYVDYLKPGDVIVDKKIEIALNNLNDLPYLFRAAYRKRRGSI